MGVVDGRAGDGPKLCDGYIGDIGAVVNCCCGVVLPTVEDVKQSQSGTR